MLFKGKIGLQKTDRRTHRLASIRIGKQTDTQTEKITKGRQRKIQTYRLTN